MPSILSRDGYDGPWSTFQLMVGHQKLRLLPSLWSSVVSPVLSSACPLGSTNNCPELRGNVFYANRSLDYQSFGWLPGQELAILPSGRQMITANTSFGNDSIDVGGIGSILGSTVNGQILEGYDDNSFFLGTFGLYDGNATIPGHNKSSRGFLQSLYATDNIPSLSWSYTAGAANREPPVFGSLTLGGYDQTRFDESKPFGSTMTGQVNGSDLLVQIANITTDSPLSNKSLLQTSIAAYLDTTTPYLWLPIQMCQAFEAAFGLPYNTSTGRYSVNGTLHDKLLALKANVTFSISETATSSSKATTVDIIMPYSSFDLEDKGTESVDNSRYFPLMRAEDERQYTLGRAFFQDAYVIVDYENSTMQIHQAKYPPSSNPNDGGIWDPVAIGVRYATSKPRHHHLAVKYVISIVFGVLVSLSLLALGFFLWLRRQKQKATRAKFELDGIPKTLPQTSEQTSSSVKTELPGYNLVCELEQRSFLLKDLPELPAKVPVSELEVSST